MQLWQRALIAATLVGAVLALDGAGIFRSIDSTILDARYAATSRPPSSGVVLVEIDSPSLAEIGVWPWPRRIYAQLLDRLMEMGASDVAFDIDFSSASNAADDTAFAEALERSGGYAFLAGFEQRSGPTQDTAVTLPLPLLARAATPVLVNVEVNPAGQVVGTKASLKTPSGEIASLASTLSGRSSASGSVQFIDYSIDLRQIDRISIASVLDGTVSSSRIEGKQIVVGAGAIELRDLFAAPRFGTIPGPLVQIAAVETLKADRALLMLGLWPALLVVMLGATLAVLVPAGQLRRVMVPLATLAIVSEIGALAVLKSHAISIPTSAIHVSLMALAALRLVEELTAELRARRSAQERIAYLATHDVPTGALSRQGITDHLAGHSAAHVVVVSFLDLETIRAALGQELADLTLHEAVGRLRTLEYGEVARVGDRELAIAVTRTGETGEMLRRVEDALSGVYVSGGHRVHSRISIAVSSAGAKGMSADLLTEAEIALMAGAGPGDPAIFSPSMLASVHHRRYLDIAMRQALAKHEMHLVYQPQFNLLTNAYVGSEALLRWEHRELGRIAPGEFIPLAEETGYITEIGKWVLNQACEDAQRHAWLGRVAVNVSGKQLLRGDLADLVLQALAVNGLSADRLEIELTESAIVDYSKVAPMLASLRDSGITVAIDDFGTGFSSLSHLASLPFDKLKVDRSFVHGLSKQSQNFRITNAIVEMGLALGKRVLAEGIETSEEAEVLRDLGCTLVQGYLFGRPLPLDDLRVHLTAQRLVAPQPPLLAGSLETGT